MFFAPPRITIQQSQKVVVSKRSHEDHRGQPGADFGLVERSSHRQLYGVIGSSRIPLWIGLEIS